MQYVNELFGQLARQQMIELFEQQTVIELQMFGEQYDGQITDALGLSS